MVTEHRVLFIRRAVRSTARSGPRAPVPGGLSLALLAAAQFLIALDYNIVYVALPHIGAGLGFGGNSLQWVLSSYAIGFGGFLLLGGRAVGRLGQRRTFVAGLSVFGAACLAGGFAGNPGTLIGARVVQGLGAALLTPATLSLLSTTFAEGPHRNRALAVWGAAGSGGLAAGALLGGVLTEVWGWRSVLFAMVPLALIMLIAAPRWLAADAAGRRSRTSLDLAGALTATLGAALLVFGLVAGPQDGWASARVIGALVAGAVLLASFLQVERRARDPLVPPRLLANSGFITTMLVILIFQSTLGGAYYLFTTYLQDGLAYSPLSAGLAFLPLTFVSMTTSFRLVPRLIGGWGLRKTLAAGMVVNGLGIAALATAMSAGGTFWTLLPGLVIWGIGGGVTFPAMFVAAAAGVGASDQGAASAVAVTFQQVGGALGLAVLIAIAASDPAQVTAHALIDGLRTAGWVAGAASVVGALTALAIRT